MKIGDRVTLTGPLVNPENKFMPSEKGMDAGLEGTIFHLNLEGPEEFHQISVKWDNGRTLGLFPSDPFIVTPQEGAPSVPGSNP